MHRSICLLLGLVAACASKLDGPTPTIDSVMPDTVCTAQHDVPITITGAGFSPVVKDGLTGTPAVLMPQVFLIDPAGGSTEIPAANVSVPDTTGTILKVIVPMGLVAPAMAGQAAVVYGVRVLDPDGHDATLASGLTIVPPPHLVSVAPVSGAVGATVTLTLTGTGFRPGMTVALDAAPPVDGGSVTVNADGTSATVTLNLTGVAPGTYGLTITNPEGCSDTLANAFTVFTPHDITVSAIDPPFGCACADTSITITSGPGDFVSTPQVEMRPHGQATPVTALKRVAFVDGKTLTAVVPSGLALGSYDVTVINPPSDGGVGHMDNAFRVVMMPIPTIEAIVPSRGDPGVAGGTPVSIFGENFRPQVKVELLDSALAVIKTVASVTPVSDKQIDVTLPTAGMTDGAYLVRVTDLDESTYSTFSAFIVGSIGPSGNLHDFANEPALVTARRMLGGVSARDDVGRTFLYAIGGDTGGATPTLLDDVEVSQLSKFGALAAWHSIRAPNHLTTSRDAPAAVTVPIYDAAISKFIPVKTYVYVTGGRATGGVVLGSVERAAVLRNADAPTITAIAASASPGTLAAGTWYYKVAAILDPSDPDYNGSETLASDEEIVTLSNGGAVDLTWSAVTVNGKPAVGYRVYRTVAANGASQQELLIASPTGTSYTDTGATAAGDAPLPAGSLGVWKAVTGATTVARWGHQAAVTTDSKGNRFLYVLGGKSDTAAGYLDSVEAAPVNPDGQLGAFGTGTGTPTKLPAPVAFFQLSIETAANVSGFAGAARFYTLGGVTTGGASAAIAQSDLADAGGNGAWSAYSGVGTLNTRAGAMGSIVGEKLFCIGGAGSATDTTFTGVTATGKDFGFDGSGNPTSPIQSAAPANASARALGVAVDGAGFIYFIGGSSTGGNAVASVQQTF